VSPVAETEDPADAAPADESEASAAELLEQLAREVGALVGHEARRAASRHKPEIRRGGLAAGVALAVALALLTALVLVNAAAVRALDTTLSSWAAPLVLAAAWLVLGTLLALALRARVRRAVAWKRGEADVEAAREEAERAVRETLEQLIPALAAELALAAVPIAGDIATGVIDAGEELLEDVDDFVEEMVDDVPGGGVVNQMWDVALMPGRLGFRVATAFLRLGDADRTADED
jgi:hypothetical protein